MLDQSKKHILEVKQELSSIINNRRGSKKSDGKKKENLYEEISDEAFIEEVLSDSNLERITAA